MGSIASRNERRAPSVVVPTVVKTPKAGKQGEKGEAGAPGAPGTGGGVSGFLDLGSGATFDIDFSLASHFRISPSGNFTLTVSNAPEEDQSMSAIVEVIAAEGFTCTLPSGGTWGGLGEPEFSTDFDLLLVTMRNAEPESFWAVAVPGTL